MIQTKLFGLRKSRKPPVQSSSRSTVFFIGRDSRGNWIARDQAGLRGGLFVNRSEAVRFTMQENGRHARAVIMVPGILELTAGFWSDSPLKGKILDRAANDSRYG